VALALIGVSPVFKQLAVRMVNRLSSYFSQIGAAAATSPRQIIAVSSRDCPADPRYQTYQDSGLADLPFQ
jgi:hypothetical protein